MKFKQFLNEYPYLQITGNDTVDLFAEKGNWIDKFIDYANKYFKDKRFIDSVNNPFFKLFWDKKVDKNRIKEILSKLPDPIKRILK